MIKTQYIHIKPVLDRFSKLVHEKKYKKIDYKIWRQLNSIPETTVALTSTSPDNVYVQAKSLEHALLFQKGDQSFGDFLWKEYKLDNIESAVLTTVPEKVTTSSTSYRLQDISNSSVSEIYTPSYNWRDICSSLADGTVQWQDGRLIYKPNTINNEDKNIKENKMNTSNLFKFDFGPVKSNNFALSPYGLAIRTAANGWVAYDGSGLIDVEILKVNLDKMLYKLPVALKDIKAGNIIMHAGQPVYALADYNAEKNTISVIDYASGSVQDIVPTKSPFGFNFVTKIISLLDFSNMKNEANAENPFGNMLPFLMLGEDFDSSMLALMAINGTSDLGDMFKNPMMMYILLQGKGGNDMLPFLMMMNPNALNPKA